MRKRRLLALSYVFPPVAAAEAHLIAKRLAHLQGWDIDVITTSHDALGAARDDDLCGYAEAAVRSVTRVTPIPLIPWSRLRLLSRIPDPSRYMNHRVARAAKTLGIDKFDAMLSWSQYHSIHLAALQLKRLRPGLPWLAHFSDPWVDNPYTSAAGLERLINAHLEQRVIGAADRLLFTSDETVDLVMAKYPSIWRQKVRVIPHGFDAALYSGEAPPPFPGRQLVARYIGGFYGPRSPAPFYRALALALEQRPSLAKEVSVEIVGQSQFPDDPSLLQALPPGLVIAHPPVGYLESLRLIETADLLIVIDAPAECSVFFPSKLIDYLGSGRPIVALTPKGVSARVVSDAGYPIADPGNAEKAADALIAGFELARRTGARRAPAPKIFTSANTGAKLAAVLDEMMVS
jgi:hypothetical protein